MGEKHGLTDFRESHHRAKYRVYRRLSDFTHGTVADGKWSICILQKLYLFPLLFIIFMWISLI